MDYLFLHLKRASGAPRVGQWHLHLVWRCCLGLCLILGTTANVIGQRSLGNPFIYEKLGVSPLFDSVDLTDGEQLFHRLDFLEDSLQVDSTDYTWQCLQWVRSDRLLAVGEVEQARTMISRLMRLTKGQEDNYLYRLFLYLENSIHQRESRQDSALLGYLQLIELSKDAGDQQMEFDFCVLTVNIYVSLQRSDLAEEFLARARAILPSIDIPTNCSFYYYHAADVANKLMRGEGAEGPVEGSQKEKRENAVALIEKAIECAKQIEQDADRFRHLSFAYHIRADLAKTLEEEVQYMKLSRDVAVEATDIWMVFQKSMRISQSYTRLGQLDSAWVYLSFSKGELQQIDSVPILMVRFFNCHFVYYEGLSSEPDSTLKYLKLLRAEETELAKHQALVDMEQNKSKFQDAQQKVTILEQEAELAESVRKTNNLYLVIGSVGVLAILLSIFFFRVRASNRKIKLVVGQLEQAVEEKIVLIHEVNHRVKNNLQMITSFVDVQSRGVVQLETIHFGNGIRKRIRAVSLVHELMLVKDRLSEVRFDVYATELIEELESIHFDGESMQSHINIEDVTFDLSTTMHLGILLNELVSNSIKHASKRGEVLEVHVQLQATKKGFTFTYFDSGDGIPEAATQTKKQRSVGLYLIQSMANQLEGELIAEKNTSGGKYTLHFPPPEQEES